jgi:hypothetical protein
VVEARNREGGKAEEEEVEEEEEDMQVRIRAMVEGDSVGGKGARGARSRHEDPRAWKGKHAMDSIRCGLRVGERYTRAEI